MLERCAQMADAFVAHLRAVARKKGDAAKQAAAAAVTREGLLAGVHYFRCRDAVEQVGRAPAPAPVPLPLPQLARVNGVQARPACARGTCLRRLPLACVRACICARLHECVHLSPVLALPPPPALGAATQLAAVEVLPAFLDQHPAIRLVVIDSVTFHFRQVVRRWRWQCLGVPAACCPRCSMPGWLCHA